MSRAQPEAALQKSVAIMLRLKYPKLLWFHVPNSSIGPVQWRKKLADMWVRAGVPDLVFIFPGGHIGLIELKAPKGGTLSDAQKGFRDAAVARGALWAVCRTLGEVDRLVGAWEAYSRAAA